jgi:large subunit ribosomal protein L23
MNLESLILSPLVTEKGTMATEKANQVVFRVRPQASKDAIRQAIEQLFKVTVVKVRTSNFLGKARRRGMTRGRQMNWKKAYVTLKEGDRIEFFEGV